MMRITIFCVLVCAAIHFAPVQDSVNSENELDKLKKQRVQLLTERMEEYRGLQELDRLGKADLIDPGMDLIRAQLDYETDKLLRQDLYKSLIKNYDMLIELAEMRMKNPPNVEVDKRTLLARGEVLFLKSERTRVEILSLQDDSNE